MKANNHWRAILVAASDETPNSLCKQKQDEKPIAPIHLVIHLSESSLKHHRNKIVTLCTLSCYSFVCLGGPTAIKM